MERGKGERWKEDWGTYYQVKAFILGLQDGGGVAEGRMGMREGKVFWMVISLLTRLV